MAFCSWRRVCVVMRIRWVRRTLCILVPLICFMFVVFWTSAVNNIIHYLDCSDYYSKVYLKELVRIPLNGIHMSQCSHVFGYSQTQTTPASIVEMIHTGVVWQTTLAQIMEEICAGVVWV